MEPDLEEVIVVPDNQKSEDKPNEPPHTPIFSFFGNSNRKPIGFGMRKSTSGSGAGGSSTESIKFSIPSSSSSIPTITPPESGAGTESDSDDTKIRNYRPLPGGFLIDDDVEVVPDSDPEPENENEGTSTPGMETETDNGIPVTMDLEDNLGHYLDSTPQTQDKLMQEEQLALFNTLKRFTPSERLWPVVRPTNFQHVAFKVDENYRYGDPLEPHPINLQDAWDEDHVPMPFSDSNIRTVSILNNWLIKKNENGHRSGVAGESDSGSGSQSPSTSSNWSSKQTIKHWELIQRSLRNPIIGFDDLRNRMNWNKKFSGQLTVLKYTLECVMTIPESQNFYSNVLPFMVQLCLDLPKILTCAIPLLKRYRNLTITLSQKQIASLLANAFFSTFPKRLQNEQDYPSINFKDLLVGDENDERFLSKAHKLRCLLHYFERLHQEMPVGAVSFTRRSLKENNLPNWESLTQPLKQLVILNEGTIEKEGSEMLQVDFANRFVGGGVLGRGTVQEEILFVTYPEMMVSRLFTDKLFRNEALIMTGCERFSEYKGYAETFEFAGDFIDCTGVDARGRKLSQWAAIDALYIRNSNTQFHPKSMARELNKAYIGFYTPGTGPAPAVASGKWGCGAFNGDPELKAVLQLMSASLARRDLAFFTFGDTRLQRTLCTMYEIIKDKTIQEVWLLLKQYYSLFCSNYNRISLSAYFEQYVANGINEDIQELEEEEEIVIEIEGEFPDD